MDFHHFLAVFISWLYFQSCLTCFTLRQKMLRKIKELFRRHLTTDRPSSFEFLPHFKAVLIFSWKILNPIIIQIVIYLFTDVCFPLLFHFLLISWTNLMLKSFWWDCNSAHRLEPEHTTSDNLDALIRRIGLCRRPSMRLRFKSLFYLIRWNNGTKLNWTDHTTLSLPLCFIIIRHRM